MRALFRADASLQIGTGHDMRCLTLADELRERGAVCCFICRSHPGNLIKEIELLRFDVVVLPYNSNWAGTVAESPVRRPCVREPRRPGRPSARLTTDVSRVSKAT